MPVVPSPAFPSVSPSPNTGIGYQSSSGATPEAFGSAVGVAEQKLGAEVEKTSDVLAKHAMKMQEDLNTTLAKDLFLKGDVEVGKLTVAYNSLEGLQKVAAYDQHVKDIEGVRERLKSEAPNSDVAKKFDQDFARRVGYSIVDGARGAATANKQVQKQTNMAVRASTLSTIAANSNDDVRFEMETKAGLETFKAEDEYRGQSPEVQAYRDREYVTAAWATRLDSMSRTDPLRARDLLDKNKDKIDGGKVLQMKDTIDQRIIQVDSRVSSDKIIQSGVLTSPELKDWIKRSEGYTDKAKWDFKQMSSGYGTRAEPGDENIPPEQRRAIYEQRLDRDIARAANIVDQFAPGLPKGTREALIDLTFNAGSKWTSEGLGQSIRAGDYEKAQGIFTQYTKAGGVDQEALIRRRAEGAARFGGEARDADPVNRMTEALDKAKERAIQVFPDDPGNQAKYLDTLQSRIRADQSVMESAARQMQLDQRNAVQKELINDPTVTSYDRLSPAAKQAYDLSPPSQQDVFNRQMRKNATADVPMTQERQNLYDKVNGLAMTNPDTFMGINVTELDLPRASKSKFSGMQAQREALVQRGMRTSGIMADSQALLNDAGIRPSTQDKTMNDEFMKFKGVLDQRVQGFIDEKKRPPNAEEGRGMVKELTREIVTSPGYIWGNNTARAYNVVADPSVVVTLDAEDPQKHFNSLPRGAKFKGPDGQQRTKP